jgi:hypothetical protein
VKNVPILARFFVRLKQLVFFGGFFKFYVNLGQIVRFFSFFAQNLESSLNLFQQDQVELGALVFSVQRVEGAHAS